MKQQYVITSRAVIVQNKNILLCRLIGEEWYFFPGGDVEFNEVSDESLAREIKEELGVDIIDIKFIGVAENIYSNHEGISHEINAVFHGSIPRGGVASKEKHIEFHWLPVEKLLGVDLRPIALRDAVNHWLGDGHHFWVTQK